MEESGDVQYAGNKALLEKNKRRRFKTPSQLLALEEFYNEHKYPTESMKAELAEKLGLTEKQISGWFCHRRLKDKRKEEILTPGKQDLSSDVIQDRGSGLRQDSCSSTKQEDLKVADIREVESQQLCHENSAMLNYELKRLYDGDEMNDTSSESNSALQESFYPHNRSTLDVETPEYHTPSGFIPKYRGRVGPSGYLKIKGQTENAAITAVKRQLGRHYREDGPPLGIEFDPLPPGAFESPSKNASNDSYRVLEPMAAGSLDISGFHKHPGFSNIGDQETYVKAKEHKPLHKSDRENFSYCESKQKHSFPYQSHGFSSQKSSSGVDSYSARGTSDYDSRINRNILYQHDPPRMPSETFSDKHPQVYSGKVTSGLEEPWTPSYDNANLKVARKRGKLDSRHAASAVWLKDHTNYIEDRMTSTRISKDEAPYMDRTPMRDHHNSIRLKMCPTKDLRAGKRGRGEFLQEDYAIRTSSWEPSQWSRHMKGPTVEMPSSFSDDETAETCSSVD